eukprot:34913-Amphidinium_carterae.1
MSKCMSSLRCMKTRCGHCPGEATAAIAQGLTSLRCALLALRDGVPVAREQVATTAVTDRSGASLSKALKYCESMAA